MDLPLQRALERYDVDGLRRELEAAVAGAVRFDDGARAAYSTDASNYRRQPIGVVVPATTADVLATVRITGEAGVPLLGRGGGTSLAGQCTNTAVVLDFSRHLTAVTQVDPEARTATVEPGVVLDDLQAAARRHGLRFGPDPATHSRCTLGGMIGNNSCGMHSLRHGRTSDNVRSLDVVTGDGIRLTVGATSDAELARLAASGGRLGEIYSGVERIRRIYADRIRERFARIPRRVSGYNLDELLPERGCDVAKALVGTESTCVTVLSAELELVEDPPHRVVVVLGYADIIAAADDVPAVLAAMPSALEGADQHLIAHLRRPGAHGTAALGSLPGGDGWLLAEFTGATAGEARDAAEACMAAARGRGSADAALLDEPEACAALWQVRDSGLGAIARASDQPVQPGWEDSAVAPEQLGAYLRGLHALLDRFGYAAATYGHFGEGCVHTRIPFELTTAPGVDAFGRFLDEAAELVVAHGGSLSGEHGDGVARGALLGRQFGEEVVQAMREFKALWDPQGRMNPGQVVDAPPATTHLRLADVALRPGPEDLHFSYPADGGSFLRATQRCVGIGTCRATDSGTMCPSYMVTREEEHSTRGRARLLFEMATGNERLGGWASEEVHEALDLCLSCKGCKGDCPADVDMATYKAEFLAHHYQGRLRPRGAYAVGLIHWASRAAARMPDLANLVGRTPGLAHALRWAGQVDQRRTVPRVARQTFRRWFERRDPSGTTAPDPGRLGTVMLWPDTFNDHLHPGVGAATVELLESLGYDVTLPPRVLCCGRPLYDVGFLELARRQLHQILEELRDDVRAGVAIIGMEPSCIAVFRDELANLMPHDRDAQRLGASAMMLTELLERDAEAIDWGPARRRTAGERIVLHGHCHQESLWGMDADVAVLRRAGFEVELLDSGCCGMAGAFGFEQGHYEVSVAAGERVWLPAVRAAEARGEHAVTSGYSCREQAAQVDGIRVLHTAEVLRWAFTGRAADEDPTQLLGTAAVLRANRVAIAAAVVGVSGLLAGKALRG